ncbi:hypothetical protein ACWDAZ_20520 [Streptomyces sp. NPDC001215]
MAMDIPHPRDLTPTPPGKPPLSKREQRDIARNEQILLLQERTRALITKMRAASYTHVEDVAKQLALTHLNQLAAEHAKTDNPMAKLYLENAMDRYMQQMERILLQHNG